MAPYGGAKWLFWLASVVLLLIATLVYAKVIASTTLDWTFPAGVLSAVLALMPVWGPPAP